MGHLAAEIRLPTVSALFDNCFSEFNNSLYLRLGMIHSVRHDEDNLHGRLSM